MLQCVLILKGSRVVSPRGSVKKSSICEDSWLCLGPVYPWGKPEERAWTASSVVQMEMRMGQLGADVTAGSVEGPRTPKDLSHDSLMVSGHERWVGYKERGA